MPTFTPEPISYLDSIEIVHEIDTRVPEGIPFEITEVRFTDEGGPFGNITTGETTTSGEEGFRMGLGFALAVRYEIPNPEALTREELNDALEKKLETLSEESINQVVLHYFIIRDVEDAAEIIFGDRTQVQKVWDDTHHSSTNGGLDSLSYHILEEDTLTIYVGMTEKLERNIVSHASKEIIEEGRGIAVSLTLGANEELLHLSGNYQAVDQVFGYMCKYEKIEIAGGLTGWSCQGIPALEATVKFNE